MAAVEAHPPRLHVADKQFVFSQILGEPLEALRMDLLDLRNLAEVAGDLGKALLLCLLSEGGVDVAELVQLMLAGQFQQLEGLVRQVDGIVGGNGDILTV